MWAVVEKYPIWFWRNESIEGRVSIRVGKEMQRFLAELLGPVSCWRTNENQGRVSIMMEGDVRFQLWGETPIGEGDDREERVTWGVTSPGNREQGRVVAGNFLVGKQKTCLSGNKEQRRDEDLRRVEGGRSGRWRRRPATGRGTLVDGEEELRQGKSTGRRRCHHLQRLGFVKGSREERLWSNVCFYWRSVYFL